MTLQDLFNQLAIGELAQIGLSNQGTGIDLENQKKLLPQINLGLLELHKRFFLREKRCNVRKLEEMCKYEISDPAFLKVEKIFDPMGNEVVLDKEDAEFTVFLPTWNVLEIPKKMPAGNYDVIYRAKNDKIEEVWLETLGAEMIAIPIPPTHVYALELFVASQIMTPMGFDGEMHEGNNYAMKFESAVLELTNKGFRRQRTTETSHFNNGGWV